MLWHVGNYMSGHKPFSELTRFSSLERNAKVAAETSRLRQEMTLQELREALNIQQDEHRTTHHTHYRHR